MRSLLLRLGTSAFTAAFVVLLLLATATTYGVANADEDTTEAGYKSCGFGTSDAACNKNNATCTQNTGPCIHEDSRKKNRCYCENSVATSEETDPTTGGG